MPNVIATLNFAPGRIPLRGKSPQKCIWCTSAEDGQVSSKVWLTSIERRQCSNEAKTWNPLKFAGVPQAHQPISAVSGPKFTTLRGLVEEILLFSKTPSPWNLGSNWPTPPDSSEFWHVLPCSASTVRASEKSSIMTNRKSYKAFQWAINQGSTPPLTSSKWG